MPPLEERTEYPYQNIRTKNFQWGDGDKVSRDGSEFWVISLLTRVVDSLVSSDSSFDKDPTATDLPGFECATVDTILTTA